MGEQPRFAGVEYPLRPMIAVTAGQLPLDRPGGWAFEPKLDGFRCIAFRNRDRVALQSRQQRPLGLYRAKTRSHPRDLQVHPPAGPGMIMRWPHDCST